jgi:hypothetical protein
MVPEHCLEHQQVFDFTGALNIQSDLELIGPTWVAESRIVSAFLVRRADKQNVLSLSVTLASGVSSFYFSILRISF